MNSDHTAEDSFRRRRLDSNLYSPRAKRVQAVSISEGIPFAGSATKTASVTGKTAHATDELNRSISATAVIAETVPVTDTAFLKASVQHQQLLESAHQPSTPSTPPSVHGTASPQGTQWRTLQEQKAMRQQEDTLSGKGKRRNASRAAIISACSTPKRSETKKSSQSSPKRDAALRSNSHNSTSKVAKSMKSTSCASDPSPMQETSTSENRPVDFSVDPHYRSSHTSSVAGPPPPVSSAKHPNLLAAFVAPAASDVRDLLDVDSPETRLRQRTGSRSARTSPSRTPLEGDTQRTDASSHRNDMDDDMPSLNPGTLGRTNARALTSHSAPRAGPSSLTSPKRAHPSAASVILKSPTTPRRNVGVMLKASFGSTFLDRTPKHKTASVTAGQTPMMYTADASPFLDSEGTPRTPKRATQESDRYIAERTGNEEAAFRARDIELTKRQRIGGAQASTGETDAAQQEAQNTYTKALLSESGLTDADRAHRQRYNACLSPDRNYRRTFTASAGTSVLNADTEQLLMRRRGITRHISRVPFKVLDAPELQDDFYLNLVDWSSSNVLAVGLNKSVYLWEANNSRVQKLCDLSETFGGTQRNADSVTSVGWLERGSHLAVGTSQGAVHLYDIRTLKKVRSVAGHSSRVGTLAAAGPLLTSGSRDKSILVRDLRSPEVYMNKLSGHRQEVCGLKWSIEGHTGLLASGGNDNKLCIWEGRGGTGGTSTPTSAIGGGASDSASNYLRYKFADHCAAVKAIAWSPNTPSLLASGGGTADRKIRFWNTTNGTCLSTHDTGSQVCNLSFSKNSSELVSTHGYSQNQVIVWRYGNMQQLAQLTGHTYRVLYLAMSPDGQTIVTGAGDETLRFWNVFSKSQNKGKHGMEEPQQMIR